jgi:hypothetical protein
MVVVGLGVAGWVVAG